MTLLSFVAFILLPRQFHVAVVENNREGEIKRAVWLYPLYLVLINLFVVPIALRRPPDFSRRQSRQRYVRAGIATRKRLDFFHHHRFCRRLVRRHCYGDR